LNKNRTSDQSTSKILDIPTIDYDRYRVFIEDIADGFFETNLKGDFIFFNDAFCNKIFGYTRKEMKSRSYKDFLDKKNQDIAFKSFNELFRKGKGLAHSIWNIKSKNGEVHILEISVELIFDKDQDIVGFRGIAQDITEKELALQKAIDAEKIAKQQYKESRHAEKRLQTLLQFLPDPIMAINFDNKVQYINPAFERIFGWSFNEVNGNTIQFVPEKLKEPTRQGISRLYRNKSIHNFETKRLTKDGRLLDILIDGAVLYDENNHPAGQVLTLRDITQQKRLAGTNQILFRISEALHHYARLDDLIDYINKEIKELIMVEGAFVLLLDERKEEFYFYSALFLDSESEKKFKEIRFPADQGVSGHVKKTGKPLTIQDAALCPFFLKRVDEETGMDTKKILAVPIQLQGRTIGVLTVVNKYHGDFDNADTELLSTIASTIALPIENTRINHELRRSYRELKSLNTTKDRVIHHLSHELKTPVAVLSASMKLLTRKIPSLGVDNTKIDKIINRADRNLKRLLEIQYEVEDLLIQKDYKIHNLLTKMVEACKDELEILIHEEVEDEGGLNRIREHIDALFGPVDLIPEPVRLDLFLMERMNYLKFNFEQRTLKVTTEINHSPIVYIPPEVLNIMIEGLFRNAVENTPDMGTISVLVKKNDDDWDLIIRDHGVGITSEKKQMIFDNFFTAPDTMQYATRKPYDFNAGGKGFDLLRIKLFSEQYNFKLLIKSKRCKYIPKDEDICPGDIRKCRFCQVENDCHISGGTSVHIRFPAYKEETDIS